MTRQKTNRFRHCHVIVIAALVLCVALTCPVASAASPDKQLAAQILDATKVTGGIIVHVGCGDGKVTAALRANDGCLVQGLDTDAKNVAAARKHIRSLGLYGPVSADTFDGKHLPYIDNLVNLVVAEDAGALAAGEVVRVLAPNGVAYIKTGGKWTKTVKPRPAEMDEWTHYLHDPSNNAVARDSLIEPPTRYQWVGGELYGRQHDHMSSVSAVVSTGGRVFTIFDEAPRASILVPPQWRLIARDAFNGMVLWKRDVGPWHEHLWPLKSGPQIMARRLVAVGDRVYVTLGTDKPLVALDAATGKTLRTYDKTGVTEEIICHGGVLFLSVADKGQPLRSDPKKVYSDLREIRAANTDELWSLAPRTLMAVEAESGKVLWRKKSTVASLSLAVDDRRVLFHDGERIQCLDRADGRVLWSSQPLAVKKKMRSSSGVTMVISGDVVLYSGMVATEKYKDNRSTTLVAVSLTGGKTLWKAEHVPGGHMGTPDDILVAGGLVWCGAVAKGQDSGIMVGREVKTGKIVREFPPTVQTHWFHHRCYRAKATEKYLLFSRTGIEFIDHAKKDWTCHHWVRGACHYGIMPCNGLIYAPQHPCACYIEAKLFGFTALAPPSKHPQPRAAKRLERGPAYDASPNPQSAIRNPQSTDWPTFRADAARSGRSKSAIEPTGLKRAWDISLNTPSSLDGSVVASKLSSPVVADGKLFVAAVDEHTVHALDATTGKKAWSFTAGGRVDSPPTIWRGRALFGSADGYVYCLRASDGELIWRYRAAPIDRRMGAFEQVESVWPVSGGVLVQNDEATFVAGRSMFLDGGLRLIRLDPKTGRKISETILDERDPVTKENLQVHIKGLNMPVGLPDILSSDGKYVYMRSLPFTLEGKRKFVTYVDVRQQQGDDLHLFSPTGFLDDTLWHRTYWVYGRAFASGAGGYHKAGRIIPAGRLLVFDDENVYGYGRHWQYYRWTTPLEFHLFAARKQADVVAAGTERKPIKKKGKRTGKSRTLSVTRFVPSWSDEVSVQVTAMVLADNALFAAGPPDVADEVASIRALADSQTRKALAEQSAAFEGRRGGLLVAVSPKTGKRLAAYRLADMPRFDGLIAANGRLYMTTANGKVQCFSSGKGKPLPAGHDVVVKARQPQTRRPAR